MTRNQRGFTIIELLVSMAIMVGITAVIFSLVDPSRGIYRVQPEVSDMQQRLRVGTSFMSNDLMMAGAGTPAGGQLTGSLLNYFAPVQPYRIGRIDSDPAQGIFYRPDAITIMYIPANAGHTTLNQTMPIPSAELIVEIASGCSADDDPLSCKFEEGERILIFDDTGSWDPMTITEVQDDALHLQHNLDLLSKNYCGLFTPVGLNPNCIGAPPAQVAEVLQRTYYINRQTNQLMYYDGAARDEAVADNVVDLTFEYFGEPRPPALIKPVTDPTGPWTTYGPKPPPLGSVVDPQYPAGENCAFMVDPGTGRQVGRLADLAPNSQELVPLTEDMLTDGPFCPNNTSVTRFDADLLRLRKVGVRLRVQVASAELRGPAGVLFTNAGTSNSSRTLVADQEIRFEITPRNFNLGR